ncbi:hypothetical protein [Embleya sp. MST-111070]|uniref:hypothetical protein n=1 Tax=Embleya sp. MST-111070 TaxID=3398231 RepID=UPI003F73E951
MSALPREDDIDLMLHDLARRLRHGLPHPAGHPSILLVGQPPDRADHFHRPQTHLDPGATTHVRY